MQVEAGPFGQPAADQSGLVSGGVVQDDMHVQIGRDGPLDGVQEGPELLATDGVAPGVHR